MSQNIATKPQKEETEQEQTTDNLTQEEMDELLYPPEVAEIRKNLEEQEAKQPINNPPPITENDTAYHNKRYGCNPSAFYHYPDKDGATIGYMVRYDFVIFQSRVQRIVFKTL